MPRGVRGAGRAGEPGGGDQEDPDEDDAPATSFRIAVAMLYTCLIVTCSDASLVSEFTTCPLRIERARMTSTPAKIPAKPIVISVRRR